MAAPASNASRADCAICSGETGTIGCCRGSVKTPFKAHVRIALDIGRLLQSLNLEEKRRIADLNAGFCMHIRDSACLTRRYPRFHLHGLKKRKGLSCFNILPRLDQDLDNKAGDWRCNPASIV